MEKIEILKSLIEQDPTNPNTWYLLGIEYVDANMSSEALHAFSESLKYCNDEIKEKILAKLSGLSGKKETPQPDTSKKLPSDTEEKIPLKIVGGQKNNQVIDITQKINDKVTFKDVGGLEDVKKTVSMKIIKPFINPSLFSKFKKKIGGGLLLYGPPGCGKTFIAKATAGECNAHFIPVSITDVLDPYVGVSARNIKDIFIKARQQKPCVLFFDEVDTIGYNRARLSSEHMRPVIDQLLTEIEGIDSNTDKLLIVAATNTPWDVDPALKRPGRFDKAILIPPPDKKAREIIFKIKTDARPVKNLNYSLLAENTELYSGADIENVVELAAENVIEEIMVTDIEREIETTDILNAIKSTNPTTLEWLRTANNYVTYSNQSGLYNDVKDYLKQFPKLF